MSSRGRRLFRQPVLENGIELLVEEPEVRVRVFPSIPEIVPVIGKGTGKEVPVRADAAVVEELWLEPAEEVFEPVERSGVVPVAAVVMRPERVEADAGEHEEVLVDACRRSGARRGAGSFPSRRI